MKKEFDFSQVGKRMPYTVPEGFMDEARREARAIAQQRRKPSFRAVFARSVAVAAAVAVIVGGLWIGLRPDRNERLLRQYDELLAMADIEDLEDLAAYYDDDLYEFIDDEEMTLFDEF